MDTLFIFFNLGTVYVFQTHEFIVMETLTMVNLLIFF